MEDIKNAEPSFRVKTIKDEIKKRSKNLPTFPNDFEKVMAEGWLPTAVIEAVTGNAGGKAPPADYAKELVGSFFSDLDKATKYGFDNEKGVSVSRSYQLERAIKDALKKAQNYISYLNKALAKLPKEEKPKKKAA